MTNYRLSEPRTIAAEIRDAKVMRLPRQQLQQSEAKGVQRDTLRTMKAAEQLGYAAARRDANAKHPNTGNVWDYPAVTFPPRAKPTGRDKGKPFFGLPEWYRWAMERQSVTPEQFAHWRRYAVNLTPEECAALFRINRKTIEHWESGRSRIPFATWYVMHCHLQKPDVWLSRSGFTDLYVDYRDGIAYLCSVEYPDIRFTHGQLVNYVNAMQRVEMVKAECERAKAKIDELIAENTELRRMFKGHQVMAELERMQAQIGGLLNRMHTADVYAFPIDSEASERAQVKAAGAR